jgi:hypothetical protein
VCVCGREREREKERRRERAFEQKKVGRPDYPSLCSMTFRQRRHDIGASDIRPMMQDFLGLIS